MYDGSLSCKIKHKKASTVHRRKWENGGTDAAADGCRVPEREKITVEKRNHGGQMYDDNRR